MTPDEIQALIRQVAQANGVDPDLALRVAHQESRYNPSAVSPRGAQGVMQLMPATAKDLGVDNPMDASQNVNGGVRYLRQLADRYGGDQTKIAAAYNWGMGNVDKKGLDKMPAETRNYVDKVAAQDDPYAQFLPGRAKPEDDPYSQFLPQKQETQKQATQKAPEQAMSAVPETLGGRIGASAGSALTDLWLGAKQRANDLMINERGKPGGEWLFNKMGYDPYQTAKNLNQEVVDKRALDKPLLDSSGGTTGRVLGYAGAALPTMLVPGASTLGASVLAGMGMGWLDPTADGESVTKNVALGGAGGLAGYGVAKALGAVGNAIAGRNAAKAAEATPLQSTLKDAQAAGYKFDPTATNPTLLNRVLSGTAGKTNLAQRASIANQQITNELAAVDIGLSKSANLTPEAIQAAKAVPAKVYEQMRGLGEVPVSDAYTKALDGITQKYAGASKSFAMDNPIAPIVEPFKVKSFDSSAAVDAIALLREKASQAFRQGNNDVGRAQRAVASALEEELGKAKTAPPELLDAFRQARTTFAKIHTVENALNEATGNVAAAKIGSEFAKGKPLSGNLATIGKTQQAFQKSMATMKGDAMPGISPFDMMTGTIASGASGNPAWLGTMLGRPLLQNALLSNPYQRMMGTPSMPSNLLPDLLKNKLLQESLRTGLLGNSPQFSQ